MDNRDKRKKLIQLYAMLANVHIENRRLQQRIADQRATYLRWREAVLKAINENRQRRESAAVVSPVVQAEKVA
jgi:phage shock protein A